ncbi:MAG: DNA alkylation repair protein [Gammaproteobacteria bacterium]|nr:DNA alkylation repair protein [Gammaproteobacteria bacterium]
MPTLSIDLKKLQKMLRKSANPVSASNPRFFKIGPGDYAEHDRFLGVTVPALRKLAKTFEDLSLPDIKKLLQSRFNEERQLALFMLVNRYKQGNRTEKTRIYDFYLKHLAYVNNWNLVDASAHLIMGAELFNKNNKDKTILKSLAMSDNLWERRVAIVSTWTFIQNNDFQWTLKIAKQLLKDSHDLIHKAVGWMLREVGKKDVQVLITFLDRHAPKMPRTMLRYAIEHFSADERKMYLQRPI